MQLRSSLLRAVPCRYKQDSEASAQHLRFLDVLYCTVLYCTVLYCTVLYCTVLYCTVMTEERAADRVATQKEGRRESRSRSFDSGLTRSFDEYGADPSGENVKTSTLARPARRTTKRAFSESGLAGKVHVHTFLINLHY